MKGERTVELGKYRITNWMPADAASAETVKDDKGFGRAVRTPTDTDGRETNSRWCAREVARLTRKGVRAMVVKATGGTLVAVFAGYPAGLADVLRNADFNPEAD